MDADLLLRQPGDFGRHALRVALVLGRGPHVATVGAYVRRTIHRLHRGVMEERHLIDGLDALGRAGEGQSDVAPRLGHDARPLGERDELCADASGIERRGLALVPYDFQGATPLDRLPVRVGHDGHAGRASRRPLAALPHPGRRCELHHRPHTGHGTRFLCVDPLQPAAQHRGSLDRGDEHARHLHIDAEDGAAIHLDGCVEPRHSRADDPEGLGLLERDVGRHRERRRPGGECSVRETPAGRHVDDCAPLGTACGGLDVPGLRGGSDEHLARGRARLAQRVPGAADRVRATGAHLPRPRRGVLRHGPESHAGPVRVELVGQNDREARLGALTHLRFVDRESHRTVGADADPGVGSELRCAGGGAGERLARREVERDDEAGPGSSRGLEKLASSDVCARAHAACSATCTAASGEGRGKAC